MLYRVILIEEGTGAILKMKDQDPVKLCLRLLFITNKKFNGGERWEF
jgi:hypothetical protein